MTPHTSWDESGGGSGHYFDPPPPGRYGRGECPACGLTFALRQDGQVRKHGCTAQGGAGVVDLLADAAAMDAGAEKLSDLLDEVRHYAGSYGARALLTDIIEAMTPPGGRLLVERAGAAARTSQYVLGPVTEHWGARGDGNLWPYGSVVADEKAVGSEAMAREFVAHNPGYEVVHWYVTEPTPAPGVPQLPVADVVDAVTGGAADVVDLGGGATYVTDPEGTTR